MKYTDIFYETICTLKNEQGLRSPLSSMVKAALTTGLDILHASWRSRLTRVVRSRFPSSVKQASPLSRSELKYHFHLSASEPPPRRDLSATLRNEVTRFPLRVKARPFPPCSVFLSSFFFSTEGGFALDGAL